ncbi:hypothetical protein QQS45_09165 [Alteriqipengyuania flavescens]|uniref:hypothetical protein n=1 Tax=Alteriqipengyuania flavescens TaxID=3053610 RepID=UPI0025B31792|nr:hypothetical protein [Alteriqipengyuania flavescens]WJY17807.1 hypothetical protein QQW98_09160 [Alteriqipengyuania flavescens]WJY23749.1 hypothetical protein QQS45_09165 [Alteriqipengyuania flavescens]
MVTAKFSRFQVYGQRCSGTNALIKLLERNLEDLEFTEEFGFKHWLVPPEVEIPEDVLVVVIARQADQWLRSLHARPWHAHPDMKDLEFGEFIRAEWRSVWDEDFWGVDADHPRFGQPIEEELCPQTGLPFANAIAMRTAKLRNWIDVASRAAGHVLVSHAELVFRPERVIERLVSASQSRKSKKFIPVTTYKGQNSELFVASEYPPLAATDSAFIGRYLDRAIEKQFGLNLPTGAAAAFRYCEGNGE